MINQKKLIGGIKFRKGKEGGQEGGRKITERVGETYNGLEMHTFKSKVWV